MNAPIVPGTYFRACRLLFFSSNSLSVDEDGVVLAEVLTGDFGGSTLSAAPTLGALATLCMPSRPFAPGGAKWLPFVKHETSIWLIELWRRLRLLSPLRRQFEFMEEMNVTYEQEYG